MVFQNICNPLRSQILFYFRYLLCNAFKFTKGLQCAHIPIITKKYDYNDVIIEGVKDTGTGIDKVILPKLFTKFTTKSEAGVGLGLYNSKNIIKAHNSKI